MISIDVLPDDVLLEIFYFSLDGASDEAYSINSKELVERWQSLVHVCRRWRSIVFVSPRRLNLRLRCTPTTLARDTLEVWPTLPLAIYSHGEYRSNSTASIDNISAVLERNDCVCQITLLWLTSSQLGKVSAAMRVPFPELTHLELHTYRMVPVLPDSFLGGYAPRLERLQLEGIPLPSLPTLLLSATHLVDLCLIRIPRSGYVSPVAMVTVLSTLTCLRSLLLEFHLFRPDLASRRPPPSARSVLPVLACFIFNGVGEYLDDIVARIDAPRLKLLSIKLFNQNLLDAPQFVQFVGRTSGLRGFKKARVCFGIYDATINLFTQASGYGELFVTFGRKELDWQVSSLKQVCTSCLPLLYTLEDLYIFKSRYLQPHWQDHIGNTLWLELLQPFAAVKNLHLCEEFAPRIVPALQELVGSRATEVLPTLQNIFLEELQPSGPVKEGIEQFVATREVASHPITVSRWETSQRDKAPRPRSLPTWGSRRVVVNTMY